MRDGKMEHDRACWGVLRRTKGDAAFPEVIPLCATRVVVGRRPEHYEAPDTVFRTASAHDDALPDVASTQIDRVALEASKRLSKVHCIFQRTEDTMPRSSRCTRTTASRSTRRPWARARARR